jgi:hypothetical protein
VSILKGFSLFLSVFGVAVGRVDNTVSDQKYLPNPAFKPHHFSSHFSYKLLLKVEDLLEVAENQGYYTFGPLL